MPVVLKPETWAVWLGRSARMLEATVAQPIESQVVGVDKAIYMKSVSGNDHLLAAGKTAVKNRVGTLFTADLDAADPPQRAGAVPHNDTQRRRVHQALPAPRPAQGVHRIRHYGLLAGR
jgi:hypothetical protein